MSIFISINLLSVSYFVCVCVCVCVRVWTNVDFIYLCLLRDDPTEKFIHWSFYSQLHLFRI